MQRLSGVFMAVFAMLILIAACSSDDVPGTVTNGAAVPDSTGASAADATTVQAPDSLTTESSAAMTSDSLDAMTTESSEAIVSDSLDAMTTESSEAMMSDSPDAMTTELSRAMVADSPDAMSMTQASILLGMEDKLGSLLVDVDGRTLYLFTNDGPNVSNCTGGCAGQWPPLITMGDPIVGDGLFMDRVGSITRQDGTTQATYNGWPLYYFVGDGQPGDINGQNLGQVWFAVTPEGEAAPAQ